MLSHNDVRILIVDDYPPSREHLRACLAQLGFHHVRQASSGIEALRLLRWPGNFDLVISDDEMSPLTGLDLLDCMQSDASLRNIPLVMMSAESGKIDVGAAIGGGACAYLVKPFSIEALAAVVAKGSAAGPFRRTPHVAAAGRCCACPPSQPNG
ncbi:MAG TPA: response regulator [Xanthobacteraceae bacterium]|jgi:two-component system chemotaxis response regulator CheY|nr:response regulator [Xanthobacteraceae bacterium]